MKKLLAISFWLLAVGMGCMTSAAVVVEATPTVAVQYSFEVENEAVLSGSDELQDWIPERFDFEVCTDVLHVRSGPRFGASVEGYKYRGDVVTVTEMFDGWGMIEPARWVKLKFLC